MPTMKNVLGFKVGEKTIEIKIGDRIKELREEKNISLADLSKRSGVEIATLSRIENKKMVGTLESHARIAYSLDVELYQLYQDIKLTSKKEEEFITFHTGGLG